MKMLISTAAKQKCDVLNCKNEAAAYFAVKGRTARCYLCADCLSKLSADVLSAVTPKSPQNAIKRLSDKREREKNGVNE